MLRRIHLVIAILFFSFVTNVQPFENETLLFKHLFEKYNKWIRPVEYKEDPVRVGLKMILRKLVDIDEKKLLLTTSIVLHQTWTDINLRWNRTNYGNISYILVPSNKIWKPDVVLFENLDGHYNVTYDSMARLEFNGTVTWSPSAFYKSLCPINVAYFPFDTQKCSMKFTSWSYDGRQVELYFQDGKVDDSLFRGNPEWHINDIHLTSDHDSEPTYNEKKIKRRVPYDVINNDIFSHPTLSYCFVLHRLPLFYIVFIILPCIGVSFLTTVVFALPSESNEKIILNISVLLAHSFYIMVLTEIMPRSSSNFPIIAEYLLFNMICISLSIILSAVSLNIQHRSHAQSLPPSIRKFMLRTLPKLLRLERPKIRLLLRKRQRRSPYDTYSLAKAQNAIESIRQKNNLPENLRNELEQAIRSAFYIMGSLKQKILQKRNQEEWRHISIVFDRLFLVVFLAASCAGTTSLIISTWLKHQYLH